MTGPVIAVFAKATDPEPAEILAFEDRFEFEAWAEAHPNHVIEIVAYCAWSKED